MWKVARYTTAAPFYFEPLDHYLDGGLRANNPTAYAFSKIQSFLDEQAAVSHVSINTLKNSGLYRLTATQCKLQGRLEYFDTII